MGSMSVLSCRWCMFMSCVHHVAVLNDEFCMTLLMLVVDARDDHIEEFQEDTACTRLKCCRHLHKLCLHNPCPQSLGLDSVFWASRPSLPATWLALLLTKAGDVE